MLTGVVRSLDRANKLAYCQITSHGLTNAPCHYYGEPPPPLSMVRLMPAGMGTFEVLGPLGDVRTVLDEDFLHTDLIANTRGYGDTTWIQSGTLGSIGQGIPDYPVVEQVATARAGARNATVTTSHTTTTFDWNAGDLILLSMTSSGAAATSVLLSDGTPFVLEDQIGGMQLWYCIAPIGVTGGHVAITLSVASAIEYIVDTMSGADRDDPIVQSLTNSNAGSTNLLITLAAFAHPDNATYRSTWLAVNKAVTPGAGMTELRDLSTSPDMQSEWAAGQVLGTDQTWVGATVCAGIAIEVRAATVDPFPTSVGVAQLQTDGSGNPLRLSKSTGGILLGVGEALWISARAALDGTVAVAEIGIVDLTTAVGTDEVTLRAFVGFVEWQLHTNGTVTAGDTTIISSLDELETNRWYDVDLVIVGGQWAAAWIGNTGPAVAATNVPGGNGSPMESVIEIRGTSTSRLWVDWFKVRTINAAGNEGPLVNPNLLIESLQAEEQPPEPADD